LSQITHFGKSLTPLKSPTLVSSFTGRPNRQTTGGENMNSRDAIRLTVRITALGVLTACLFTVLLITPNRAAASNTWCEGSPFQCYQPGHYYYLDPESCSCVCNLNAPCEAPQTLDYETCSCVTGPDVCDNTARDACLRMGGSWQGQPTCACL
jgi:hypothetical protein